MTKKEQIKEMTNIQDGCIWSSCEECIEKNRKCDDYKKAEAIYNAGYRKIDDKHVVIMKEELHRLKSQLAEYKKPIDKFIKQRELKAVREFAEKLKEKFNGYEATYYNGREEGFHDLQEEIDELLKEYEK